MTDPHGSHGPRASLPHEERLAPRADDVLERLRAATAGEYDVHSELARGGMASVFLAHDLALDRSVAIKVMSPGLVFGPGMAERFKREARTAAALSHPNVIPVYAVREVDGLCFFVMKLIQGTTLDGILGQVGQAPIGMVHTVLAQAGSALGYAHRKGVIHRDVKPGNIMIDDEGWVVVTDFGIAKVADAEGLTLTGMAVGTPAYMSPEQCLGGAVGPASDQYSLGVIAYEMLTGRRPFGAETSLAMMYAHAHTPPPPLESLRPDCPEPLGTTVLRMLAKDPATRFPSMEGLLEAIGGPPVGENTARNRLVELAKTGTAATLAARAEPPRSPIPITRARPRSSSPGPGPAPAPSGRGWLLPALGGIATAALGMAVFLAIRGPGASSVAPDPSPAGREAVTAASEGQSPGTPPPAPDPAPPVASPRARAPTRVAPPVRAPARGEPVEAAHPRAVADAGSSPSLPAAAESTPVPRVATPPVSAPPLVDRPVAAPVAVDPRSGIQAAIERYRTALESGDLARIRRSYPGMTADQQDGLQAFFASGGTLRATWTLRDFAVTGDTATATITGVNRITTPRSGPADEPVNLRVRLERQGEDWRLMQVAN